MTYVILVVTVVTAQNNSDKRGVVINGVKWATRNVGMPGFFVASPENYGKSYTWNEARKVCPTGWRLPTKIEIESLVATGGERTTINDVIGSVFGSDNDTIFLPAGGDFRYNNTEEPLGFYWCSNKSMNRGYNYLLFTVFNDDFEVQTGFFYCSKRQRMQYSVRCVAE